MRKIVSLVLAVVLLLALCVGATAAEAPGHEIQMLYAQATAAFKSDAQENLTVEVSGLADGQYIILVLSADIEEDGTYTAAGIEPENILYINQEASVGGKLTFDNVFPKEISDSVIMIAGSAGDTVVKEEIALINAAEPEYRVGDVDGDDYVGVMDASMVLQYEVGMEVPGFIVEAGDVDGDDYVGVMDASLILQYEVGMFDKFPVE